MFLCCSQPAGWDDYSCSANRRTDALHRDSPRCVEQLRENWVEKNYFHISQNFHGKLTATRSLDIENEKYPFQKPHDDVFHLKSPGLIKFYEIFWWNFLNLNCSHQHFPTQWDFLCAKIDILLSGKKILREEKLRTCERAGEFVFLLFSRQIVIVKV